MTETSKKPAIQYITASILVGVLVVLDQMTKYLAIAKLKDKDPFVIIDGVFDNSSTRTFKKRITSSSIRERRSNSVILEPSNSIFIIT